MPEKNNTISYSYSLEDKFLLEDLENRHLYINSEIDEQIITDVAYHILRFNREDAGKEIKDRKPIRLFINTPGGEVVSGFGLIDTIITSATPVYTINIGECASMGFLIYIAGAKRFSMPHGEFLLHEGVTGGIDSSAKMRDRIEFETGELAQQIKEYVISRTKIDKKTYDKQFRVEWYFLPKKGIELGVVDYIIGEEGCSIEDIL